MVGGVLGLRRVEGLRKQVYLFLTGLSVTILWAGVFPCRSQKITSLAMNISATHCCRTRYTDP